MFVLLHWYYFIRLNIRQFRCLFFILIDLFSVGYVFFSSFGIAPKEAKALENFNRSAEFFGQPRGVGVGGRRTLDEPPLGLWGRVGLLLYRPL